jgi:hypothetical protein
MRGFYLSARFDGSCRAGGSYRRRRFFGSLAPAQEFHPTGTERRGESHAEQGDRRHRTQLRWLRAALWIFQGIPQRQRGSPLGQILNMVIRAVLLVVKTLF